MAMAMATEEPGVDYYSVALIGSSGGGTATLGHTDPVELLTTIHQELLRVGDVPFEEGQHRRVCIGISHAIFISLCDGSGFDAVRMENWLPEDEGGDGGGPMAALYCVGFDEHGATATDNLSNGTGHPFRVTRVSEGPLTKINKLAQNFDIALSQFISECYPSPNDDASQDYGGLTVAAIISISSEPTTIHSTSLGVCNELVDYDIPIVGSGGTSLSQIASLYDLRIVGNSGGSVASTTLTKARGWAMGLAEEWDMIYDESLEPAINSLSGMPQNEVDKKASIPTLKSILEAALPSFLFVCISLRMINTWGEDATRQICPWIQQDEVNKSTPICVMTYALQHIAIGTTCSILAATSRSSSPDSSSSGNNTSIGDQSTLLMSATVAGVLASASASQSSLSSFFIGGGGALAGLVAGALIPVVLSKVSKFCFRYHVTATMTNILCGGGVGLMVGVLMHFSGLSQLLGLITGIIRNLLRWRFILPENGSNIQMSSLEKVIVPVLRNLQEQWSALASNLPTVFYQSSILQAQTIQCSSQFLPVPMGLGFLYGCIFVYGSKIGMYHSLFLPAILLEMDSASMGEEASLLGAIDECTLVMVCAGICLGNLTLPPSSQRKSQRGESANSGMRSLSWQALKTNILCGDFIEAAYPSMESSKIVNGFAYLAAGLSTEIIIQRRVLSSAYMPLPMAIWISNDRWGMGIACSVALAVSLFGTLASNLISLYR